MTTPITIQQQQNIINSIRALVPDRATAASDRRAAYMIGAVLALQSIDHSLVHPHWLICVMANRTQELFKPPAKLAVANQPPAEPAAEKPIRAQSHEWDAVDANPFTE